MTEGEQEEYATEDIKQPDFAEDITQSDDFNGTVGSSECTVNEVGGRKSVDRNEREQQQQQEQVPGVAEDEEEKSTQYVFMQPLYIGTYGGTSKKKESVEEITNLLPERVNHCFTNIFFLKQNSWCFDKN